MTSRKIKLNYNSTYDSVQLGSFRRVTPNAGKFRRRLWASVNNSECMENAASFPTSGFPTPQARALFEKYLNGSSINVSLHNAKTKRKGPWAELKRLQNDERVWHFDLREKDGNQWRIFGCFIGQNEFVALFVQARKGIDFEKSGRVCIKLWERNFGELQPLVGIGWDDYLSGPVYDLDNADPF